MTGPGKRGQGPPGNRRRDPSESILGQLTARQAGGIVSAPAGEDVTRVARATSSAQPPSSRPGDPTTRPATRPSAGGAAMRGTLTTVNRDSHLTAGRPPYPLLLSARTLTPQEFIVMAGLYFPYLELMRALAIGQRESGLWTAAWNWNPGVEDSRGLMQINIEFWVFWANYNLWDPQIALYAAGDIFKAEGWEPWRAAGPKPFPWS